MTGHGSVTIIYDGDGNRVSETVGGVTTKYLVDTLNPTHLPQVLDETVNGSLTRTYAYGLQRINENQLISGTWTPSFYSYDGHGEVRLLTSTAEAVTDVYQYDAFGNQIATTGTTPNNFLYSGEQFDSSVGLLYLRARYYRLPTGRFLTMDPYQGTIRNPATLHKYAYTANNPVNFVDPTGRDLFEYGSLVQKVTAGTLAGTLFLGPVLAAIFECTAEKLNTGPAIVTANPPGDIIGVPHPSPGQIGPQEYKQCSESPHEEVPPVMFLPPPARFPGQPGFFPPPVEEEPIVLMDQQLTGISNYEIA